MFATAEWGHAREAFEAFDEGAVVVKAAAVSDARNGLTGVSDRIEGVEKSDFFKVLLGGMSESRTEQAREVSW